jgi:hypothetical protein
LLVGNEAISAGNLSVKRVKIRVTNVEVESVTLAQRACASSAKPADSEEGENEDMVDETSQPSSDFSRK